MLWALTALLAAAAVCGQYQVVVEDLGISPMHVILTYKDTLIYIDRSDVGPTRINTSAGVSAYSVELNMHTLEIRGLEYFANNNKKQYYVQLLVDALPYNLYPFVHQMTNGHIFLFAGALSCEIDMMTSGDCLRNFPNLTAPDGVNQTSRTHPFT
eukprot:SM000885S23790  [mRNA]  locus=s885:697:1966:- [translate_table: standard]